MVMDCAWRWGYVTPPHSNVTPPTCRKKLIDTIIFNMNL
jgi:hypothetical protein